MRVLLIQTQAENAGAQEIARLVGDGLAQRSHEIQHLFFYRKTASFDQDPKAVFVSLARPRGIWSLCRLTLHLIWEIRRFQPDTILCFQHYGNILGSITARLALRAPVIANQLSDPQVVPAAARWLDKMLGASGAYDVIVVNSQATERAYEQHPARYRKRLVRVEHGFAPRQTTLTSATARERLRLPPKVALLGCVARLHRTKRLDLALNLLPHLPHVHLALAGQGPDEASLRRTVEDLGLSGRVHFQGELPPSDIATFLAALDVFVFPSEAETFGLAVVEAAQSGVPCVVHDLPVLREVLNVEGQSCAIFVDCADLAQFAQAVEQALSPSPGVKAMTNRGRRLLERYPVKEMIDGYEALLVSAKKAPVP